MHAENTTPSLFFKRFEEQLAVHNAGTYEYSPEVDGLVFHLSEAEQAPPGATGSGSATYSGGKWDFSGDVDYN